MCLARKIPVSPLSRRPAGGTVPSHGSSRCDVKDQAMLVRMLVAGFQHCR
jgi:hypothetical protein